MNPPSRKTTGIVCTVLGGMLSLWVIARLSSAAGWQQTWAPPFAAYEWTTLGGSVVAGGLLITGLMRWTRAAEGALEKDRSRQSEMQSAKKNRQHTP